MNADGVAWCGWLKDSNDWYWLRADGTSRSAGPTLTVPVTSSRTTRMLTGWQLTEDDNRWYMRPSGQMVTSWLLDGGKNGTWTGDNCHGDRLDQDGDTWYHLGFSGAMSTGWLQSGAWYWQIDSGAIAVAVEGVHPPSLPPARLGYADGSRLRRGLPQRLAVPRHERSRRRLIASAPTASLGVIDAMEGRGTNGYSYPSA